MFDKNLLTVFAHDINDIFKNAEHNRAFLKWLKSISENKTPMNHDFIVNIKAAQERPMTGPIGSSLALTYREYFERAAWIKDMPPIDQFQIIPDEKNDLSLEKTRDFSEDPVTPRKDWTKSAAEPRSMPRKDWTHTAKPPEAKPVPKTDWEKLMAPSEPKPVPKKDWTKEADAPREFKTLPLRKPSFDRDR